MTKLEQKVVSYFIENHDNRVSVIAEKFKTTKYVITRIIDKHLQGKYK